MNKKELNIRRVIEGESHKLDTNILQQDIDNYIRKVITGKGFTELEQYNILHNKWRIIYRVKPPTIEEFLTEEWIGKTADTLYPKVLDNLHNFWSEGSKYRHLILAGAIGTGKSFTSTLWSLYITTSLWCMRNPKKFFGLSQAGSIVNGLISFTQKKANQVLLQPFLQILKSSPKFYRVKQEEFLDKKQEEMPDKICWTTAGRMGSIQFYNDLHYVICSSYEELIGLNLITAIFSELSFFIEKGHSTEDIWKFYEKSKERIQNRFGKRRFVGTVIDSSPNDIERSSIDKYIFSGEAEEDETNMVITGAHWETVPSKYPIWLRTGETFPVFRGNATRPACIVSSEEVKQFRKDEIIFVPIDSYQRFKNNIIDSVKNICGYPSGTQGLLIRDLRDIDKIFVDNLRNIYTYIYAPSNKSSNRLIWDNIQSKFFIKKGNKYEFYRNPLEYRMIHVDQAESKDLASISMVHQELDKNTGEVVYITDFNIVISPQYNNRINLDAIRLFIKDLRELGNIKIGKITFDQYQSKSTIQYLKEIGINADLLSVDRDVKVYKAYVSLILSGRVKVGKNIFLKNNLRSLQEVSLPSGKLKVDHTKGTVIYEDGGDWEKSSMGSYGKDASDAHCGAVWNSLHFYKNTPIYLWDEEEVKSNRTNIVKNKVLSQLKDKYKLEVRN